MSKRDPFPLQWPDGFARTPSAERTKSQFGRSESGQRGEVPFAQARSTVLHELELLGAANVVITSDLPIRLDGLPYASGRAQDPGIAVWFVRNDQERVFACDRWKTPGENLRAIALSIKAMRGLGRWGMADVVERAMGGFAALPPGSGHEYVPPPPVPKERPWREVLEGAWPTALDADEALVLAKARHRKLIKIHHPDAGGDPAKAAEINAALAAAEKELAGGG